MKHVVMFSSGAGSWAAARRVRERHGTSDLFLVFADTKGYSQGEHTGEDADNYRFLREAFADIGGQSVWLSEGRDVWSVFFDQRFIGNTRVSNCSRTLKQEPAKRWVEASCDPSDSVIYVGIDWTEQERLLSIRRNYTPFDVQAPLCEPPYLDRSDVFALIEEAGLKRPRLYDLGFAHANCGGFCVRSGQGQFVRLLEKLPDRYAYHEAKEAEFRSKLGKDVAILRDRRGGTTKPLTLRRLRERVQNGDCSVDRDDLGGCGCFVDG